MKKEEKNDAKVMIPVSTACLSSVHCGFWIRYMYWAVKGSLASCQKTSHSISVCFNSLIWICFSIYFLLSSCIIFTDLVDANSANSLLFVEMKRFKII